MSDDSKTTTKIFNHEEHKEANFCARRTRTEIFLALALIGVVSFLIYYKQTVSTIEVVKCEEPEYMDSILEINDLIDPLVDPCKDFHQFVCGNFFKTAYTKQITTPLLQEVEQAHNEILSFIVEPVLQDDSKQVKLQKSFFKACLDESAIELDHEQTLLALIEQIGGWPVLKGQIWQEEEFDWVSAMIKCSELGLPFQWFLKFGLYAEEDKNILQITCPSIANNTNNSYKKLMENVAIAMSGSKSNAHSQMAPIVSFEQNLLNVIKNNAAEIRITSLEELQKINVKYNWLEILNNITGEIYQFNEDTPIASNIESYLLALDHLLIGTPKRVQANYIVWKIIEHFSPHLSVSLRNLFEYFQRKGDSRVDVCITNTEKNFPYVAETEYIRKYAKPEIRNSVKSITNLMRNEFVNRLAKAFWIKNDTLSYYLEKFKETEIDAGGQDEIFDETFFDDNYLHIGNLEYNSNETNIIEMITKRWKSYYESVFSVIDKPGIKREKTDLYFLNVEVAPHLYDVHNRIVIPASLIHGFMYDHRRPKYLNYGSLGSIIGQELTRSFLHQLREDDAIKDIWTHKDYKVFENGTKCFEDDLSKILEEESAVNVSDIIQETIPYIIGRDLAYTTYQKWVESNEKKIKLLPLSYNSNQLFWIKSSLINCYKVLINDENNEISDPIIFKYKNILSLRHSPHFERDFNCSPNPKRCWLFL